jgi:hypothetical protein
MLALVIASSETKHCHKGNRHKFKNFHKFLILEIIFCLRIDTQKGRYRLM